MLSLNLSRALAIVGIPAMAWFRLQTSSAAEAPADRLAATSDYHLAEAELKVVLIDSDPAESFLALELDSAGRLFAGAREALFVYEPATNGLYQPRHLIYRFPKDSWIYGIAIRRSTNLSETDKSN